MSLVMRAVNKGGALCSADCVLSDEAGFAIVFPDMGGEMIQHTATAAAGVRSNKSRGAALLARSCRVWCMLAGIP
jgi:hypothetical protein